MKLPFCKYNSCGNDFILIDDTLRQYDVDGEDSLFLCDRKRGVGADGVITLTPSQKAICKMRIFNSDGSEAEMCGNGIRCVGDYLRSHGHESGCFIETMERIHRTEWSEGAISVEMGSPKAMEWEVLLPLENGKTMLSYLDTGVPHAVVFVSDIASVDVATLGCEIRNHPHFLPKGTNATFAAVVNSKLYVRTYERGVEGETLACGTGATAAAIAASRCGVEPPITVVFPSQEELTIDFRCIQGQYIDVVMKGHCRKVYEGVITLGRKHP